MKYKLKNKLFLVIAAIALTLGFASCDDFFEQEAGNKITPELHYQTQLDLQVSMVGVLAPLQEAMPRLIIADGLLSDQMNITPNTDVDITAVNNHTYSFNNPYLNLSGLYQVIINANEVLANIDRITEIDPTFDEFYVKQYENALIGMRSWAYFTLARFNGEVAYIEDNLTSLPEGGLQYMSKEVVLDTLINQLLPYLHLDTETEELYFGGFVNTKALIGEIYLEKDDYENAAFYLKLGMESYNNDNAIYKVKDKIYNRSNWQNIFLNAENEFPENISVIPFKSTDDQYNPVTGLCLPNDQYLVRPATFMFDLYNSQVTAKDRLGDVNRGVGVSIDSTAGVPYIKKYALDESEPYSADIIISRAADVHLLLAEAYNRLGQHDLAMTLMNSGIASASPRPSGFTKWNKNVGIRGRVVLKNRGVPSAVTNKMEYIEDLIMEERLLELAFEGKRYFDLIRIAERRNDTEYLAGRVYKKFDDKNKGQEVKVFLRNQENWFIPLNK